MSSSAFSQCSGFELDGPRSSGLEESDRVNFVDGMSYLLRLSSTGLDPPSIDVIRSIVQRAFEESRLGCDVVLQHVSEMSLSERLLDTEQVGSQGVMPVEGGDVSSSGVDVVLAPSQSTSSDCSCSPEDPVSDFTTKCVGCGTALVYVCPSWCYVSADDLGTAFTDDSRCGLVSGPSLPLFEEGPLVGVPSFHHEDPDAGGPLKLCSSPLDVWGVSASSEATMTEPFFELEES
jgi:hypothetical protein